MPTYKFKCSCGDMWEAVQKIGEPHVSFCATCGSECASISFGGTGVQYAGKHFSTQLQGFPDNTRANNTESDKLAAEMEKESDAYDKANDPATKEMAKQISEEKRKNRATSFRENP